MRENSSSSSCCRDHVVEDVEDEFGVEALLPEDVEKDEQEKNHVEKNDSGPTWDDDQQDVDDLELLYDDVKAGEQDDVDSTTASCCTRSFCRFATALPVVVALFALAVLFAAAFAVFLVLYTQEVATADQLRHRTEELSEELEQAQAELEKELPRKVNIVFAGGFLDTEIMQATLVMKRLSEDFAGLARVYFITFSALLATRVEEVAPRVEILRGPVEEARKWLRTRSDVRAKDMRPSLREWLDTTIREKVQGNVDYWIADWISAMPQYASTTWTPAQVAQSVWYGNSKDYARSPDSRAQGGFDGDGKGEKAYVEWVTDVMGDPRPSTLPSLRAEDSAVLCLPSELYSSGTTEDPGLQTTSAATCSTAAGRSPASSSSQEHLQGAEIFVGRVFPIRGASGNTRSPPAAPFLAKDEGVFSNEAPVAALMVSGQEETGFCPTDRTKITSYTSPDNTTQLFLQSLEAAAGGRQIVYLSLGTLYHVEKQVFDNIVADLSHLGPAKYYVVLRLSLKKDVVPASALPPFIRLERNSIDQTALLCYFGAQRRLVFASSCGVSSLGEAMQARVPVVALPFQPEQRTNAVAISRANVGVYVGIGRVDPRETEPDPGPDALQATSIAGGIETMVGQGQASQERYLAALDTAKEIIRANAFDGGRAAQFMLHVARTKKAWKNALRAVP
ncbi:unnamed protein product [Amoebophrya sp. A120]|nr:unnamed protein product [Amoebophrya sp. A120]|eukprot:GSA120T00021192001.1